MDKTPITLLNEYCAKNKLALKFTLLSCTEKKEFVYQANTESVSAVASGSSKKIAKHSSAQKLLQLLNPCKTNSNNKNFQLPTRNMPDKFTNEMSNKSSIKVTKGLEVLKNSIVELHELSQQMKWPLPLYEFSSINSPTEPFTCTVRLDSHIKLGMGKSKKLAKLNASSSLLYSLRQNNYHKDANSASNGNSNIAVNTNSDYLRAVEDASILLKEHPLKVLRPCDSQKIAQFYKMLKARPEKTLASLQNILLNHPATNYVQMLEEIAEEQNFSVVYTDLNDITIDSQKQCMVQLGSFPVAVVHGSGETTDHARYQAAHNALQYLKIMTRKI